MIHKVRRATADDDIAICDVLRRSIMECCIADHLGDPAVISAWLENKTPQNVAAWVRSQDSVAVVATQHGRVVGFALANGDELALCYVLSEFLHQGIGRKLLIEVETHSAARGIATLRLESTRTALQFYLRNGFVPSGPPQRWAGMEGQPMVKPLMASHSFEQTPFG